MKTLPLVLLAAGAAGVCLAAASRPAGSQAIQYGRPKFICNLACQEVAESSGLAASRRTPGVFWTHNDSGNPPCLYAFDMRGRDLGAFTLDGAANRDWEDIASFTLDGKPWLLVADTGDNDRKHKTSTLYLLEEPAVDPNRTGVKARVGVAMTIPFAFDDGPQDCEAVAVDPTLRRVYLISKRGKRTVYELPLPAALPAGRTAPAAAPKTVAKSIAALDMMEVVAMDISPDGLRAILLTYWNASEFTRSPGETWAAAFARGGRRLAMPGRKQGESICYGLDGRTLYLTSEKLPTPLLEVPVAAPAASR